MSNLCKIGDFGNVTKSQLGPSGTLGSIIENSGHML